MKRVWGHFVAGGSLLACGAAIVTACVHDDSSVFVYSVLSQPLVQAGGQCSFTADPTQLTIPEGVVDIAFRQTYEAEFLIANQIVPRGDPTQPQTETSYVVIQGAVVRITDSQGGALNQYTQLASVTVPPAQGTTPSYAPIGMTILNQQTIEDPRVLAPVEQGGTRRLITYTRFFGQTLGGESVETGEYEFPVDVCFGCLVSFAAADIDPALPTPNCAAAAGASTTTSSTLPVPCIVGEDAPIDCSQCLAFSVCSGAVPASSLIDAGGGG